jgi:Phage integrase family
MVPSASCPALINASRHTFASLMIAAGVNAKALQTFMGHSSVTVTYDLYGHLLPGSEAEAAGLLDRYLCAQRERAEEQARAAEALHDAGLGGASGGAPVSEMA